MEETLVELIHRRFCKLQIHPLKSKRITNYRYKPQQIPLSYIKMQSLSPSKTPIQKNSKKQRRFALKGDTKTPSLTPINQTPSSRALSHRAIACFSREYHLFFSFCKRLSQEDFRIQHRVHLITLSIEEKWKPSKWEERQFQIDRSIPRIEGPLGL